MSETCMGITIRQGTDNRPLAGFRESRFDYFYLDRRFTVSITQCRFRDITIHTATDTDVNLLWDLFDSLDTLLMLFDGEFIPIIEAFALNVRSVPSTILTKKVEQRAAFYWSADYARDSYNRLVDFASVLCADLLHKWMKLRDELDITHQMVMYSMADTGLPPDCKCAFLIESFKALTELLWPDQKKPSLSECLKKAIHQYGTSIFQEECAVNEDGFIRILVNSRDRIAHIKSVQNRDFLDGSESVLYCAKLSLLYRRILLDLLGVDYNCYSGHLSKAVQYWNARVGIAFDRFLSKLRRKTEPQK